MFTALTGAKPDVMPAAPCYLSLYFAQAMRAHYIEQYRQRLGGGTRYQVDHAEDTHFRAQAVYRSYSIFTSPPDWIEVDLGASKAWAERTLIIRRDEVLYYEDGVTGVRVPMHTIPLPHGDVPLAEIDPILSDVWDRSAEISSSHNVDEKMPLFDADVLFAGGEFDLPRQLVAEHGDRFFISTILDTPYSDAYDLLGFRGLMVFQRRHPDLLEYVLQRKLLQMQAIMQAWAETGVHGVFVEEVFTGADSISPASYDKFVFAYNQPFFASLCKLGLLPIYYACGNVLPRLPRMVACDIAAVAVEESKKKFHIEIEEVVEQVAGRVAVFGNIDAVRFGLHATPDAIVAEVERQTRIGERARGFIVSTGSPFPLETNPQNIQTLIDAAHAQSSACQ